MFAKFKVQHMHRQVNNGNTRKTPKTRCDAEHCVQAACGIRLDTPAADFFYVKHHACGMMCPDGIGVLVDQPETEHLHECRVI